MWDGAVLYGMICGTVWQSIAQQAYHLEGELKGFVGQQSPLQGSLEVSPPPPLRYRLLLFAYRAAPASKIKRDFFCFLTRSARKVQGKHRQHYMQVERPRHLS